MQNELQKVVAGLNEAAKRLDEGNHGDVHIGDVLFEIMNSAAGLLKAVGTLAERLNNDPRG